MYLFIIADLHLTSRAEHPERFSALEAILAKMKAVDLKGIVLAGDTFDASFNNYSEFDAVCKQHPSIHFYVIPGNHDPDISKRQIIAPNVTIYTQPTLVRMEPEGLPFLCLPYERNKTMGERIAEFAPQLPPDNWVLVAHGDYLDGPREANPYGDDGLHMPLTRRDITIFRPAKVFLGHIHASMDKDPVYFTGSPCGLDISETGQRRYLVYDTQSGKVESQRVNSDLIFYDETLTVLPMEDETVNLRNKAQDVIKRWDLEPADYGKVRLRLKINGYTTDKNRALQTLTECFAPFHFNNSEDIDCRGLNDSRDSDRIVLAEIVRQSISRQTWLSGPDEPDRDAILLAALDLIYGGKNASSH